jgi:ribose transport system ATP-binding protein
VVTTATTSDLTTEQLVRAMVGRDVRADVERSDVAPGDEALAVRGLTRHGVIEDVSFRVRVGEILGIAGLAGAGRTEVLRAVFGADPLDAGEITVFGEAVRIRKPRDAVELGIGLLTEDRKVDGLLLAQSVGFNITISQLDDVSNRRVLSRTKERRAVARHIERLAIRTPSASALVRNLSGGNQQKAIFAKWLHANCRILLVDEPTRGVDVGAKHEIHTLLTALAARGVAIVVVSSELPEILAVSDRVIVMREGRVTAELGRDQATEEQIMYHATHHGGHGVG